MKKIKISWLDKFLFKHFPQFQMKRMAKRIGVENVVFDKAHEVFDSSKRVDLFPLNSEHGRGFLLVLDRQTAFYFYQDGDHFKYDGYEMGKYDKGDVTIFDRINQS